MPLALVSGTNVIMKSVHTSIIVGSSRHGVCAEKKSEENREDLGGLHLEGWWAGESKANSSVDLGLEVLSGDWISRLEAALRHVYISKIHHHGEDRKEEGYSWGNVPSRALIIDCYLTGNYLRM